MKTHILFIIIIICPAAPSMDKNKPCSNPGCIRQNSDELLKDVVASAIQHANIGFIKALVNKENVNDLRIHGSLLVDYVERASLPGETKCRLIEFLTAVGGKSESLRRTANT